MPTIGIRKNAWDSATAIQKKIARKTTRCVLGSPALYEQANHTQWLIFDDEELDLLDGAYLATLCAGLASVPEQQLENATRQQIINYLQANVAWPVTVPSGSNPFDTVLAANNAPAWLKMRDSVPAGLTPVDG